MWRRRSRALELLGGTLQIGEKRGEGHAERLSHLDDVLKTHIALTALDRAHEGPVNAAFVSKGFLGISLRQTQLSNTLPQRPKQNWKGLLHTPECSGLTLFMSTLFA